MSVSDFHFRQMVLLAAEWTQISANDPVGNFFVQVEADGVRSRLAEQN